MHVHVNVVVTLFRLTGEGGGAAGVAQVGGSRVELK